MHNVNLSRIHSMIKDQGQILRQIQEEMASLKKIYLFRILQNTTQEDFERFTKRLDEKRADFLAHKQEIELILAYIEYLKSSLAEANDKSGLGLGLLEVAALQRRLEELQRYADIASEGLPDELQEIMDVDYYKSTFTETSRFYDLYIHLLPDSQATQIRKERRHLEKLIRDKNDEIAQLNQNTRVDILTREEFAAQIFSQTRSA